MDKLRFNKNRVLKLNNVLKYKLMIDDEKLNQNVVIKQMQSYVQSKGAMQIGPLIQYAKPFINEVGELDIDIGLLLQCNHSIHSVESPYSFESVIRVTNCLYCRYIGPEDKLKFAYDKIALTAFEEDIPLKGDSYTIFVDREDDNIIADVFMERADNE